MAWTTKITPNNGWDAGARTVAYLMADGQVEFEVGQAVGIVCGLNDVDNDAGYLELDHALLLESGLVTVIEGGIKKGSSISYTPSDRADEMRGFRCRWPRTMIKNTGT